MQQAIPYSSGRAWAPRSPTIDGPSPSSSSSPSCSTVTTTSGGGGGGGGGGREAEGLKRLVAENPVLVLGRRGCCMCHVVKRLLLGLGVNPAVCEVGEEIDEGVLMEEFAQGEDQQQQQQMMMHAAMFFPAVFIGGRLVGGLDRLMAVHISGDLVPILKDAGALWL